MLSGFQSNKWKQFVLMEANLRMIHTTCLYVHSAMQVTAYEMLFHAQPDIFRPFHFIRQSLLSDSQRYQSIMALINPVSVCASDSRR